MPANAAASSSADTHKVRRRRPRRSLKSSAKKIMVKKVGKDRMFGGNVPTVVDDVLADILSQVGAECRLFLNASGRKTVDERTMVMAIRKVPALEMVHRLKL